MLRQLYITLEIINPIIAILSFVFAYIILLRRDRKNPIYFNFGMATLFLGLWLSVTAILYLPFRVFPFLFLENATFISGLLILHFFTIFTYYFPYQTKPNVKIIKNILSVLSFLVIISIFVPGLCVKTAEYIPPFLYLDINPVGLTIFSAYFIYLIILSFKNLLSKYFQSGGIHRIQLRKVLIGSAIAVFFNLVLSVLVFYFIKFDTNQIGAVFTFSVIVFIYLVLFSKKDY